MNDQLLYLMFGALFVFVVGRQILAARRRITGEEAKRLVSAGAALLDVRTPGEFARGHLPSALNVPLHELGKRASTLKKDQPVVVYCHSGARSARAAAVLKRAGLEVHDLGPQHAYGS